VCKTTGIKARRTREPAYRCKNGHEFEEPLHENADCTKYTAHFDGTFAPFTENFGRDFLRQGCPRYSDQLAMQEFDFSKMDAVFRAAFPQNANLITRMISHSYMSPEAADDNGRPELEGYKLAEGDDRERVLKQIRARRGQQAFRDKLRSRYGDQCMISGCKVLHVLEAAHICPYRGELDNHAENGLLLRADLHTLFDLDLIGIEPSTLLIHLNPSINLVEYREFHGRALSCSGECRPSEQALLLRWQAFEERKTNGSV
jgi:hypothetical protein